MAIPHKSPSLPGRRPDSFSPMALSREHPGLHTTSSCSPHKGVKVTGSEKWEWLVNTQPSVRSKEQHQTSHARPVPKTVQARATRGDKQSESEVATAADAGRVAVPLRSLDALRQKHSWLPARRIVRSQAAIRKVNIQWRSNPSDSFSPPLAFGTVTPKPNALHQSSNSRMAAEGSAVRRIEVRCGRRAGLRRICVCLLWKGGKGKGSTSRLDPVKSRVSPLY